MLSQYLGTFVINTEETLLQVSMKQLRARVPACVLPWVCVFLLEHPGLSPGTYQTNFVNDGSLPFQAILFVYMAPFILFREGIIYIHRGGVYSVQI